MLAELSVEELEERGHFGVLDPFDALRLRRLTGHSRVEKELPATVEYVDAAVARRRALESYDAAKKREVRERRLQECRDAVMRAGGPVVMQRALQARVMREQMQAARAQQQRWQQTGASTFGGFTSSSSGTSNTFFYTS